MGKIKEILLLLIVANLVEFLGENLFQIFSINSRIVFLGIQTVAIILAVLLVNERKLGSLIIFGGLFSISTHLRFIYQFEALAINSKLYISNIVSLLYNLVFNLLFILLIYVIITNLWPQEKKRLSRILVISSLALFVTSILPISSVKLWNLSWALNTMTNADSFSLKSAIISMVMLSVIWIISYLLSRYYLKINVTYEGLIFSGLVSLPVIVNYLNIKYALPNMPISGTKFVSSLTLYSLIVLLILGIVLVTVTFLLNSLLPRFSSRG